MESPNQTPINALGKTSRRPACSPTEAVIRQRVTRLAELIRKDGAPYPLTPQLVNVWVDVFVRAQLSPEGIEAAFNKAERQLKFWPAPAEVLGFVEAAKENCANEQVEMKWQQVRDLIRLHYNPDIPWRGPKVSDRTRRAINTAGGMAYLSECIGTDLVFARQRFIEAWLRWDELQQDEYLLQDGEVKRLLAEVATQKALPESRETWKELHERGLAYAKELSAPKAQILPNAVPEPVRVVDVEGRQLELARQAELIRQRYPASGKDASL